MMNDLATHRDELRVREVATRLIHLRVEPANVAHVMRASVTTMFDMVEVRGIEKVVVTLNLVVEVDDEGEPLISVTRTGTTTVKSEIRPGSARQLRLPSG